MTLASPSPYFFKLELPNYSGSGAGFVWAAECLRPYTGTDGDSRFCDRNHLLCNETARLYLPIGSICFVHHPHRDPKGVITFERYHVEVFADHVQILDREVAEEMLRDRMTAAAYGADDASWEGDIHG